MSKNILNQRKKHKSNSCRGQRGKQKIPASGHLAPTLQLKNGRFYPSIANLDEQERRAKLYNHPEDVPHWFVWLYQWAEKDPITDLWRTLSFRVSVSIVDSVQYMINSEKSVSQILRFIRENKIKSKKQKVLINSDNNQELMESRATKLDKTQNLKQSNRNQHLSHSKLDSS